jgi:23S rRNA (adenine2503-C2)-methyltransferase
MMLKTLLGLDTSELCALVQELGVPAYRGQQLAEWIYRHGVHNFDETTSLPEKLRARLSREYEIGRSETVAAQRSRDGTIKLLLKLSDGSMVETVGIPYADRFSCCLSTQVGCPVGCVFCATGLGGFTRNLTAGEIVDQVLAVQEAAGDRRVDHVVFMGMGEPLLNYEATLKAMHLLNNELGIAMRHLTVSTVGYVAGIRRLAQEKMQATLAVSLHAPTDALRRRLIPGMKWSVPEIIAACREYFRQTGRRVTFEYCLLEGVNDGTVEAQELARLLQGMNCHVNLIPYNPVSGLSFHTRSRKRIKAFREVLEGADIQVTQRVQRGSDIDAACGQLRSKVKNRA